MSLKIVFMGTPEFSVPTLETLIKNKFYGQFSLNIFLTLYNTIVKMRVCAEI